MHIAYALFVRQYYVMVLYNDTSVCDSYATFVESHHKIYNLIYANVLLYYLK